MAHNKEESQINEPRPGSATTSDFRVDTNGEASGGEGSAQLVTTCTATQTDRAQRVAVSSDRYPTSPSHNNAARGRGSVLASVLLSAVLAVICGAFGAWAYEMYLRPKPAAPETASAVPEPVSTQVTPSASVDDLKLLKKQLDDLASCVDRLQERFSSIPRPEPPPDLRTMESRIDSLEKDNERTGFLPSRLSALSERVMALERSLPELRTRVETRPGELQKTSASTATTVEPTRDF